MDVRFRPHHFLCALCFQGKGYSTSFVSNFIAIMALLNAERGDDTIIHIVQQTDSICNPCPHRLGHVCTTENQIAVLDHAHAKALELDNETIITWGQAKERIASNITLDTFHAICSTCSWQALGLCESALTRFLGNKSAL